MAKPHFRNSPVASAFETLEPQSIQTISPESDEQLELDILIEELATIIESEGGVLIF